MDAESIIGLRVGKVVVEAFSLRRQGFPLGFAVATAVTESLCAEEI